MSYKVDSFISGSEINRRFSTPTDGSPGGGGGGSPATDDRESSAGRTGSSPAGRGEIVAGKLLTIMTYSSTTSLLNLASIGFTGFLVT